MKRDRLVHLFAALTAVLLLAGSWRWSEIRPGAGRSAEAVAAEQAARADTSHDPAWRHATGALGHPLGKHFVIEGEVAAGDKTGPNPNARVNGFRVDAVDGKSLAEPKGINVEGQEKLGPGRFRLEGYEYERWLGYEGSAIVQGFYPLFVPMKITRMK
ncbi:MAG: hypothetical protein L6R28_00480 [Planctomycetes bacterium]|nr:hypothetical protein [Planctomycetota bacterium]